MDDGGPLGIAAGADGGQHSGDACADVLPEKHIYRAGEPDDSTVGQRLQDTHRGRGGLNDRSKQRAGQDPDHRIGEGGHQAYEPGHLPQRRHGGAHHIHPDEQYAQAADDAAEVVALRLFQKHHHRHADKGEERRQHSHIQGDQLSGDGGADIGPHNDPYRLPQGHHARVDKAHHHHGRGRGGLDDCSDDRAHQYAQQSVGRELFQYPLHSIARRSLQAGAHHLHPVEEQGKPPQQTQNIRNIHALYSFSVHRWKKT